MTHPKAAHDPFVQSEEGDINIDENCDCFCQVCLNSSLLNERLTPKKERIREEGGRSLSNWLARCAPYVHPARSGMSLRCEVEEASKDRWQSAPDRRRLIQSIAKAKDGDPETSDPVFATSVVGYQGFGSFHSENVEDLIRKNDDEYAAPPWPIAESTCPNGILGRSGAFWPTTIATKRHSSNKLDGSDTAMLSQTTSKESISECMTTTSNAANSTLCTPFGRAFLDEHFLISPEFTFINHGAFGGALAGAQRLKEALDHHMEGQILRFYDRELLPLLVNVVRTLSRFIGAHAHSLVLVQNATSGLNSAIRHLIKPHDVVAYLDTEYLSVFKMAYIRCHEVHATLHEIPLNRHLLNREIISDDAALTAYVVSQLPPNCTVFIVDFITSSSAMMLPVFTHLIPALRAAGVKRIIVDGAHAPLQVDLDFNSLPDNAKPDVFVGNFHKWVSCPKASAFMWIADAHRTTIEPVVISHGAREGLLSSFIWDGTRDYNAYLTLPAVLSFWEAQGVDRVRRRCTRLLSEAAAMLTSAFDSHTVPRHSPFMTLVELPHAFQGRRDITAKFVQDSLHSFYKVEVPVKQIEGRLFLRISAFVYNEEADYAYLRDAVFDLLERLRKRPRGEDGAPCPMQQVGGCGVSGSGAKMGGF